MKPILVILGPTASGKSQLALDLARELDGEIINGDSRQFYHELNIGTAKPSADELVSVKHHLINSTSIEKPWSVADFVFSADQALKAIQAEEKTPILVGGTGMYIRMWEFGLSQVPEITDSIREENQNLLKEKGLDFLYQKLSQIDPKMAGQLEPGDTQRILRALEVFQQTGKSLKEYWSGFNEPRYQMIKLGIDFDRQVLYDRINKRVEDMFDLGLPFEAKNLWQRYPENLVLQKTIGYREWQDHGFESAEKTKAEIQKNTRQFAKRQLTWFRADSSVSWLDPANDSLLDKAKTIYENSQQ